MRNPSITAILLISLLLVVRASEFTHDGFLSKLQAEAELEAQQNKLYAAVGNVYNAFIGNPLSTNDDGLKNSEVFALNWGTATTADSRFYIPKEFYVRDFLDCSSQVSSETVTGMTSYKQSLDQNCKMDASYDGLIYSASFQGSVDYKSKKESQEKTESVTTFRKIQCRTYIVAVNDNVPKILNTEFMNKLKKAHRNQDWEYFVKDYGTHYVRRAIYGAMAVEETTFSKSDAETLASVGLEVSASINGSSPLFKVNASSTTTTTDDQKTALNKVSSKTRTWVVGMTSDKDSTFNQWVEKVQNGKLIAQPVSLSLGSLEDVFDVDFWPAGTDKKDLADMKAAFKAAVIKIASTYPPVPADPKVMAVKANTSPVITNGFYTIVSKANGLGVEIGGDRTDNGAPIAQFAVNPCECQIFYFERITDAGDVYRIRGRKSGKYWDVINYDVKDGAKIQTMNWLGGENQKWKIQYNDDRTVSIIGLQSGKALDIPNFDTKNAVSLQLFQNNGKDNQKFFLKPFEGY